MPDALLMLDADAIADIEGDCGAIYDLADADPNAPPSLRTLVVRLLGSAPRMVPLVREAQLAHVHGKPRIFVRRGTMLTRARWLAGHELAEWWYQRIGYRGHDLEVRCDALGAAIVAPRPAFLRAWRTHGDEPVALAAAFGATQSLALLRLGECVRAPVVLLRPGGAIVRGEDYEWPAEPVLRRATRLGAPGLRTVRITDEPRRSS